MKRETNSKTTAAVAREQKVDSSKLMSLLALAAGAVAMPETGNASIVYTNLGANSVTVNYLNPSYSLALPGTARLGFNEIQKSSHGVPTSRHISVSQTGGYVHLKTHLLYAVHLPPASTQVAWSHIPATERTKGLIGQANSTNYNPKPPNYDHNYLPFKFMDSTQANEVLYGWVDISLSNSDLTTGQGPALTIWRYAYDDSGNQILMGQTAVPEPASMSLMALGALALGARGVRAWKKRKSF